MAEERLAKLLARHEAFWHGEGDRPLRRISNFVPLEERGGIPLDDGSRAEEGQVIAPDMIAPAQFYGMDPPARAAIDGDFLRGISPPHLCWTEAIIGCPVRVVTGGPWAAPFLDAPDADRLRCDATWMKKLDVFIDFLAQWTAGRFPIAQPLMRGPLDMMASAIGHEAMCLALLAEPDAVEAFLDRCADIFIETARRRLAHTPLFADGYVSSYGIWAPGPVVRTQVDNGVLVSPDTYRERVLPYDRKVIEAFEFPLIHVHSGCLHLADALLEVDALKVIQISIDHPGGPLAAEVMPILARMAQRKPLIITGPVSEKELGILEALEPRGRVCLQVQVIREEVVVAA